MKLPLVTALILTGVLALPFAAFAQQSVGTLASDAAITTRIKAEYAADQAVSAMKMKVDTKEGIVTLSGLAKTQTEADRAVAIAKAIEGVIAVTNDIVISPY